MQQTNCHLTFLYAFPVHLDANTHYRLHAHSYHELVLVQSGRFRSRVCGHEYTAVPCDILLYRARTPHEEWAEDGKPVLTWLCTFEWNGFALDEPILRRDTHGKVQDLLAELFPLHFRDKITGSDQCHVQECPTILRALLAELELLRPRGPQAVVEKARAFVRTHLDEPISIEDVAQHVGLSRSHFTRLFHATAGRTPWSDVQHLRVEEASRLIATTTMCLHEVASHVGIANEFHLSRLLKTILGVGVRDLRAPGK